VISQTCTLTPGVEDLRSADPGFVDLLELISWRWSYVKHTLNTK
jgi:hypothetical protein